MNTSVINKGIGQHHEAATLSKFKQEEDPDGWVEPAEKKKAVVTGGKTETELGTMDDMAAAEEDLEGKEARDEAKKSFHWARGSKKKAVKEPEKPKPAEPSRFMGSRLRAAKSGANSGASTDFNSRVAFPTLGGGPGRFELVRCWGALCLEGRGP